MGDFEAALITKDGRAAISADPKGEDFQRNLCRCPVARTQWCTSKRQRSLRQGGWFVLQCALVSSVSWFHAQAGQLVHVQSEVQGSGGGLRVIGQGWRSIQ